LAKVCEALQHAHELVDEQGRPLGLIHRDVTPENIMVSFMGAVKILDFGVAKASSAASLTRDGTLKGKYAYISPEQVRGNPADPRSDIYSVGVIAYELLTGIRPFSSDNEVVLLRKVARGDFTDPGVVAPWLPRPLVDLILKVMARGSGQLSGGASNVEWRPTGERKRSNGSLRAGKIATQLWVAGRLVVGAAVAVVHAGAVAVAAVG
jgi:serine/threonine-protein kinase